LGGYYEFLKKLIMAFFRSYQCPECEGIFKYLHHPNDAPPPDRCDLCHAWMLDEAEPVFVPQAPRIGTYKGKTPDQVYRQMEQASADRTYEMAEMLPGASASDFSHTKITDMNDNMREGDIAAKYSPPPNYVQEFMKLNQGSGQSVGGGYAPLANATGAEYAAAAHQGAFPRAGAATLDGIIKPQHAIRARAIEGTGRR
jgi:hypothetical protein